MGEREMITPRTFIFNVLNGVALAIVVGMIPNAILGELSKYLSQYNDIFTKVAFVTQGIQYSIPILTGVLIAGQFKLTQLQTAVTGAAAFVGSGASTFTDNKWVIVGIGDLINTMITASIAVGIILLISHKLGSLNMIVLPIVGGAVAGFIRLRRCYQWVNQYTTYYHDYIDRDDFLYINCFTDIINWDRFGNWHFRLSSWFGCSWCSSECNYACSR